MQSLSRRAALGVATGLAATIPAQAQQSWSPPATA
jgi:hypothetical protein